MDTISIIALILSAVSVILTATAVALIVKKSKTDGHIEISQEVLSLIREETAREGAQTREAVLGNLNLQNVNIQSALSGNREVIEGAVRTESDRAERLQKGVIDSLQIMAEQLKTSVTDMRDSNEKQLEKVRQTVDEKLTATLDERFKASFSVVAETLENITRNVGEMKNLTNDVVDLRRVLTNVKTRGTWGEVSLDNLLSQLLTPDQYERNFKLDKRGGDDKMVDFAISMPGKGEKVYLPVDAKFPVADYERIVSAKNIDEQAVARRAFERDIKTQAQSISSKYIKPPLTTNFAVMYLPTEGLFAEVMQSAGLQDELQQNYRVTVCSPTTLGAFLNCLQMGFKTVAIEKRSSEIWKLMAQFKKDFNMFSEILIRTQKQLITVGNSIRDANKRTQIIQKRLKKVEVDDEDKLEGVTESLESEVAADYEGENDEA